MLWEFSTATAAATQQLGERLASLLRAGDLLVLSGELGAGKTTFTQGLGRGLGVREGIISPTFVLVRIHPNVPDGSNPGGPDLVHVDAYRLASPGEIDDIDLENTLDSSVTVVEWGEDRVEHLAESRLELELVRAVGGVGPDAVDTEESGSEDFGTLDFGDPDYDDGNDAETGFGAALGDTGLADAAFDADADDAGDEPRLLRLRAVGPRWDGVDFSVLGHPLTPATP